jgi:hypothetical protein
MSRPIHTVLVYLSFAVWAINGLFCKVLNLVPRHEQIVARILGASYSRTLTITIGIFEMVMAFWILSRIQTRWNVLTQILVVATMNTLEFILVPDLLLFGRLNSVVALLFITSIYINEFYLGKRLTTETA